MSNPTTSSLLLATQNRGKLREFQSLLSMLPLRLWSLTDFPNLSEVDEVGRSFAENAILKAKGYAAQTGLLTLADDSGLEVDALGGAPGILSARYAGDDASDADRINKLLNELLSASDAERQARFICVIAVFDPRTRKIVTFDGNCEGHISYEPRGINGFGYDPVFIPDGYTESFGTLSTAIKQRISHRSHALRAAGAFFREILEGDA